MEHGPACVSRETATEQAWRTIAAGAADVAPTQLDRLARLVALVCATPVGVTAIRDPAEASKRHVLDALTGLAAVDAAPQGPLADVGSGGGLPGLVIAIMRPERCVHLIEATARKAAFIAEAATALGLMVEVHAQRSEDVARGPLRDTFTCVVARALAPPAIAAELCLPLCRCGGRVVLWSREQATEELEFAAGALGGAVLPPEASGVLVIGKLAATPARFPRRPGMAAKRPLRAAGSDRPPR
ncbi:MAG: rRNA (guanine527-N7)-methyltransferase [Gaiellales bacterium]|nr:rRNA (guanine527-N7)-methyltransferase [Gaiellales bacterium]